MSSRLCLGTHDGGAHDRFGPAQEPGLLRLLTARGLSRSAVAGPLARWGALLAMLLGELILLTLWIDTKELVPERRWWASVVEGSHQVPALLIAAAAAALLLGGKRLREELAAVPTRRCAGHRTWPWLLAHLAALAGFADLSALVTDSAFRFSPDAAAWVAAWAVAGAAVLGFWSVAALSPALWRVLARRTAAPVSGGLAVGCLAWWAGQQSARLWLPLSAATLQIVRVLLGLVSSEVVCGPEAVDIGIGTYSITIAPQCSGYEGIGLLWVFLAVYLWSARASLRFPHALLLIPVGTAAIWLANAARLAILIMLGAWVSPDLAEGGFHSHAGWIAFNAIALGIILVSRRSGYLSRSAGRGAVTEGSNEGNNPAAEYLVPLLVLIGSMMVCRALTTGFDALYPARVLATAGALWCYRRRYASADWSFSWPAVAIGVVTFAVWMALEPASTSGADLASALARLPRPWAAAWLVLRVAGSVVIVPMAEELAFRGYLTRRLIAADFESVPPGRFTWASFLISSALFGVLHGRWLAGALAGALFALAYYRRGKIGDAVAAHATANALIAFHVLTTGSWSLWT